MIDVASLKKDYATENGNLVALENVTTHIPRGSVVAILGPSGSGKSTFLRCINGLEAATAGTITVNGQLVQHNAKILNAIRKEVGMVFQQFNLFPDKTVLQNLMLAPQVVLKVSMGEAQKTALELLERVGLSARVNAYPAQLSGGQQQRVAIARALAMKPKILLFDEPTSALDPLMVEEVTKVIRELVDHQMTLLIVTHEINFAKSIADRVLFFDHGRLIIDEPSTQFFNQTTHPRAQLFLDSANPTTL